MLLYFYCSVALPHDARGWPAVCDCGIPGHTYYNLVRIKVVSDYTLVQ